MRLVDFQASVHAPALSEERQKWANEALFPVNAMVHFWLQEQVVRAPFRKLLITIADAGLAQQWHGSVSSAVGLCEVTRAVDLEALQTNITQAAWVVSILRAGLDDVSRSIGWSDQGLDDQLQRILEACPPCSHQFTKLRRQFRGTICEVWFDADIGVSAIKARFTLPDGRVTEVPVVRKAGPLYTEDDFPVIASSVRGGDFMLLGPGRAELARISIPVR